MLPSLAGRTTTGRTRCAVPRSPRFYLRVAARAGLRHETVPLPHEVKAMLADGKVNPADYDEYIEGIANAALAAAARSGPVPDASRDDPSTQGSTPPVARSAGPAYPGRGSRAPASTGGGSASRARGIGDRERPLQRARARIYA